MPRQDLVPVDGVDRDDFGTAVALSGNTAVVGAPEHSTSPGFEGREAGQAYVFGRSGTAWSLVQALTASNGATLDGFGSAASLSGDTIALGAPFRNQVYVFARQAPADDFSIALSPSGRTLKAGSSTTFTVGTSVTRGTPGGIDLSIACLPEVVTASFSPPSVAAGESSTLTLTAAGDAAAASQPFTVTGTALSGSHSASASIAVLRLLTSLSPATVWVGLVNSDDVGLRLDLRAEVLLGGLTIGRGQLDNVGTGSSGFDRAVLSSVALGLTEGAVAVNPGDQLQLRISARRTCPGVGHLSGRIRLWYNGQPADSGAKRDAGTRFDATIGDSTSTYFARAGLALDTAPGSSKLAIDRLVNASARCPDRPFTPFGAWSIELP